MSDKFVDVMLTEEWSETRQYQGKKVRYRLWNDKGEVYCLKLTDLGEDTYQLDISETLENVDEMVGTIFEIPKVPFDSQYRVILEPDRKDYTLTEIVDNHDYHRNKAADKLKELFRYDDTERLFHDLLRKTEIKWRER